MKTASSFLSFLAGGRGLEGDTDFIAAATTRLNPRTTVWLPRFAAAAVAARLGDTGLRIAAGLLLLSEPTSALARQFVAVIASLHSTVC